MSYYLDMHEGRIVRTPKRGRTKEGYKQISDKVWATFDCPVEKSEEQYPFNKVFMWLNASYNKRHPDLVSLSLCNASPKCPFKFLSKNRYACRIDLDLVYGSILIWRLGYYAEGPDEIILDALLLEESENDK